MGLYLKSINFKLSKKFLKATIKKLNSLFLIKDSFKKRIKKSILEIFRKKDNSKMKEDFLIKIFHFHHVVDHLL